MSNEVAEKLRGIAAEIREHPERWIQNTLARDADGYDMDSLTEINRLTDEPHVAVCWCAMGFIEREFPGAPYEVQELVARVVDRKLVFWNDAPGRTAAEVADAFERAAALSARGAS